MKHQCNMKVHNIMEEIVERMLERVMESVPMCMCDQCCMDVLALALCSLPPRYISTDKGDVYLRYELYTDQMQAEITAALLRACGKVASSPRHKRRPAAAS